VVSKKTSRSPKSASPTQPPVETKQTPPVAASAPKAAPRKAKKAPEPAAPAAPAARVVPPRKRQARVTPPQPEATQPPVEVSDDDIRLRAYFLSLEYQGSDRKDVDFWLLAERELRPVKTPTT